MRTEPVELGSGEKIHDCISLLFGLNLSKSENSRNSIMVMKSDGAVLITKGNQRYRYIFRRRLTGYLKFIKSEDLKTQYIRVGIMFYNDNSNRRFPNR